SIKLSRITFGILSTRSAWRHMVPRLNVLAGVQNVGCNHCSLHTSSVNVCVMGSCSKSQGRLVLVGEAPGQAESETGLPFQGRSGREVLHPALEELGLAETAYITNVCKCRPPKNRKPTRNEMSMCSSLYLGPELSTIKPKVVVAMGRV